jgi:RNA 3'-terminal phosphate cyclase
MYTIEVETISKQTYQILKTFDDFFELHLGLIGHFPECAGIVVENTSSRFGVSLHSTVATNVQQVNPNAQSHRILPQLPQQMMFVSEQFAQGRITSLQEYINVSAIDIGFIEMSSQNFPISFGLEILQRIE